MASTVPDHAQNLRSKAFAYVGAMNVPSLGGAEGKSSTTSARLCKKRWQADIGALTTVECAQTLCASSNTVVD